MAEKAAANIHAPVLPTETVELLNAARGGVFVDATLGLGGHSELILQSSKVRVIGIDQDEETIELATQRLEAFGDRFEVAHSNFSEIRAVLRQQGLEKVDGIIAECRVVMVWIDATE